MNNCFKNNLSHSIFILLIGVFLFAFLILFFKISDKFDYHFVYGSEKLININPNNLEFNNESSTTLALHRNEFSYLKKSFFEMNFIIISLSNNVQVDTVRCFRSEEYIKKLREDTFKGSRTARWYYAWLIFKDYPWYKKIFGGGFDYLEKFGSEFGVSKFDYPHNPIISSFLYSGIIGGLFYIYFLILVFWYYWKYRKHILVFFLMYLVTFSFCMFSGNSHFSVPIFTFLSLIPFLTKYYVNKKKHLFMKHKVIKITGSNSFIGSYFINNSPEFQVGEVDLLSIKPAYIDFSDTDVVFHVAAIVHQDKSIPDAKYFVVNSDLAFNVAQKAKLDGVKQFVFMSTVKVYGENSTEENPWTENSQCLPSDAYGKSKLEAEKRLLELNDRSFVVSIIRTPVVYGAGVKGNIQKIAKLVKKQKLIPFKGIDNKRAMVYIGNLVALIQEVIKQQKGGIFLASDTQILSTSEFVALLIESTGKKKYFIVFPKLMQSIIKLVKPNFYNRLFGSMVINNLKTCKELNFIPPYSSKKGLKEVIDSI